MANYFCWELGTNGKWVGVIYYDHMPESSGANGKGPARTTPHVLPSLAGKLHLERLDLLNQCMEAWPAPVEPLE